MGHGLARVTARREARPPNFFTPPLERGQSQTIPSREDFLNRLAVIDLQPFLARDLELAGIQT